LPVRLTIVDESDIKVASKGINELIKHRIVKITNEAFDQGGILTQADLSIVGVSPSTVSKQAREFMEREKVVLPTRGTVHDLGMGMTHKRIVLMLYLSGHRTPDISRITGHSEEAIDRYIRGFERVRLLRHRDIDYICRVTGMSHWLVKSYLDILNEWKIWG
jgi:hypothetical protein